MTGHRSSHHVDANASRSNADDSTNVDNTDGNGLDNDGRYLNFDDSNNGNSNNDDDGDNGNNGGYEDNEVNDGNSSNNEDNEGNDDNNGKEGNEVNEGNYNGVDGDDANGVNDDDDVNGVNDDNDLDDDANSSLNDQTKPRRARRTANKDIKPSQLRFYSGSWVDILTNAKYRHRLFINTVAPFPERTTKGLADAHRSLLDAIGEFKEEKRLPLDQGLPNY
jgi:hypothetical protein